MEDVQTLKPTDVPRLRLSNPGGVTPEQQARADALIASHRSVGLMQSGNPLTDLFEKFGGTPEYEREFLDHYDSLWWLRKQIIVPRIDISSKPTTTKSKSTTKKGKKK